MNNPVTGADPSGLCGDPNAARNEWNAIRDLPGMQIPMDFLKNRFAAASGDTDLQNQAARALGGDIMFMGAGTGAGAGVESVLGDLGAILGGESTGGLGGAAGGELGSLCFPAGTEVAVKDGERPIQTVKTGDYVQTRSEETGKSELKKVTAVKVKKASDLITLEFAHKNSPHVVQSITCTLEHPFYVDGQGFTPADKLVVGAAVVTRTGPDLIVISSKRKHYTKAVTVYNFTVADDHTYFVGIANGGIWVHNSCAPGPTVDPATNVPVGRFIADEKGNTMIEPQGGSTRCAGPNGQDTHTTYPNGSNYQRYNPNGHANNPIPHAHGHLMGTGPNMAGQGPSIDPEGNVVPWNSPDAHWPLNY